MRTESHSSATVTHRTPKVIIKELRILEFGGWVSSANDRIGYFRDRVSEVAEAVFKNIAILTSVYLYCMDTRLIAGWKL
jgi:hypothetical protein